MGYGCILTEPEKLSTLKQTQGLQLHFDKTTGNIDNTTTMD
jgi:hypothetical protein